MWPGLIVLTLLTSLLILKFILTRINALVKVFGFQIRAREDFYNRNGFRGVLDGSAVCARDRPWTTIITCFWRWTIATRLLYFITLHRNNIFLQHPRLHVHHACWWLLTLKTVCRKDITDLVCPQGSETCYKFFPSVFSGSCVCLMAGNAFTSVL